MRLIAMKRVEDLSEKSVMILQLNVRGISFELIAITRMGSAMAMKMYGVRARFSLLMISGTIKLLLSGPCLTKMGVSFSKKVNL